jgi:hypothetical protein
MARRIAANIAKLPEPLCRRSKQEAPVHSAAIKKNSLSLIVGKVVFAGAC